MKELDEGQTLGLMILNNAVHIFVDGILREKTSPSFTLPFWAVVAFAGRFKCVDLCHSGLLYYMYIELP